MKTYECKAIKFFILLVAIVFQLTSALAQECAVQIESPANGSATSGFPIMLKGSANVPPGAHLWVLVSPVGFNGWWPQGNGEATVFDNEWYVQVYLGDGVATGDFHVVAVIVDDAANGSLNQWVTDAPPHYHPLKRLPNSLKGCPLAKVTITKTR